MLPSATADQRTLASEQLLKRLSDGDAAAWAALLDRFGGLILTVAQRILVDAALAEDAVQESLLLIRDHAGRFRVDGGDAEAAVRRWIVRIACTTALQMLRKSKQSAKREARYMRQGSSTPDPGAAETAERAESVALVRRELAQLPDDYRLPITLHILGGLTFQDVAAELRCPVGTAKTNVHRGLERLRKRLAAFGILLPLSELAEHMQRTGLPHAVPSVQQLAQWQTLLTSSAKPAYALAVTKGGLSFMAKITLGLSAVALLTTAAVTITSARTAKEKAAAPQSAAVNGLKLTLESEKNEYKLGEPPVLVLVFKNVSASDLVLLKPVGYGFDYCDTVTIIDPHGNSINAEKFTPREVPDNTPRGANYQGWDANYVVLKPGGEYRVALAKDFYPKLTGKYLVKVAYDSTQPPWGPVGEKFPKIAWKNKIQSGEVSFSVVKEPDSARGAPATVRQLTLAQKLAPNANDPKWVAELKQKLAQKVGFDFSHSNASWVFDSIYQLTGANIVLLPVAIAKLPAVTAHTEDKPVSESIVQWLEQSKLDCEFAHGVLVIGDPEDLKLAQAATLSLSPELSAKLDAAAGFDVADQKLKDAMDSIAALGNLKNCQINPSVAGLPVTLHVSELPLRDVLLWTTIVTGTEAIEKDGALVISPAAKRIKLPSAQKPHPAEQPKTPAPPKNDGF